MDFGSMDHFPGTIAGFMHEPNPGSWREGGGVWLPIGAYSDVRNTIPQHKGNAEYVYFLPN